MANASDFKFTLDHLRAIRLEPHILGNLLGKDRLGPLHSRWIRDVWEPNQHTALQAHRGSFKTTSVTILGTVWWLLFHPDDRIAIIRKTATDAAAVIQSIGMLMEEPVTKALFALVHSKVPRRRVARQNELTWDFKRTVTPEASVTGHGLDGSITGKHYDKILLDDVITLKDRTSRAERERTKETLREIYTNIIDPGKSVGHVGTPWHQDDAWTDCPVPVQKFPVAKCGILTPEEIALKKKTTTPFLYSANYDLEIRKSEDTLFRDPIYGRWDWMNGRHGTVAHLDAAFDGDHTNALTFMTRLPSENIQAHGRVYSGNVKDWLGFIASECKRRYVDCLYIETNADKGYTADALRAAGVKRVQEYTEKQNKGIKISTHLYQFWPDLIWDPESDPEYINQILDWREGQEPDDCPDSAASLLREKFSTKAQKALHHWSAMTL